MPQLPIPNLPQDNVEDSNLVTPENSPDKGIAPGTLPVYSVKENLQGGPFGDLAAPTQAKLDIDSYNKYITEPRLGQNLDAARASNQSRGEKWMHFGGQVLGEIVGLSISGVGSFLEFSPLTNPLSGVMSVVFDKQRKGSEDFANFLVELGEGVRNSSKEALPIHRADPSKTWETDDLGWWLNNGVSVASTLGMLIPGALLTRGLGALGKIAQAGKLGRAGIAAAEALIPATQRGKEISKVLTTAFGMRHAENISESFQVVNDVRKHAMDVFEDDTEFNRVLDSDVGKEFKRTGKEATKANLAEYIAGTAGYRAYSINSLNIVFDIFQSTALMKTNYFTRTGTGGSLKVAEKQLGRALTAGERTLFYTSKAIPWLAEPSSEGIEELVNYIGSSQASTEATEKLEGNPTSGVLDNLFTFLKEDHAWEAALFGSLGGALFKGVESLSERFSKKGGKIEELGKLGDLQRRKASFDAFTAGLKAINDDVASGKISKTLADSKIARARDTMAVSMGVSAAATGNIDLLLQTLDSEELHNTILENMTSEDVKEGGVQTLKSIIDNTKDVVLETEKAYNKAVNRFSAKNVSAIAKDRLINDYVKNSLASHIAKKQVTRLDSVISEFAEDNAEFKKLTLEGVPVRDILRIGALEAINADEKTPDSFKEKAKAELAKLKEAMIDGIPNINISDEDLISTVIEREAAQLASNVYQDELSKLLTKDAADNVEKDVQERIKTSEKKKKEKEHLQYVESLNSTLKGMSLEEQIETINKEIGSSTDAQKTKYLKSRLKELSEIKSDDDLKDPADPTDDEDTSTKSKNSSKTNFEDVLDEIAGNLDHADALEEAVANVVEVLNDPSQPNALQIIENAKAIVEGTKAPVPVLAAYIERALNYIKSRGNKNTSTYKGIKVGDVFKIDGKPLIVTSITAQANGKVRINYKFDGETKTHGLLGDNFIKKIDAQVNTTDIDKIESLRKLPSKFTFQDLLDRLGMVEIDDKEVSLNFNVFPAEPNMKEPFTIKEFNVYVNVDALKSEVEENNNLTEIIYHELAHMDELVNLIPVSSLDPLISKLVTPEEYRGTRAQEILNNIKKSKSPSREFIAYYLSNEEFSEMATKSFPNIIERLREMYAASNSAFKGNIKSTAIVNGAEDINTETVTSNENEVYYEATKSAEELAKSMNINLEEVVGTGKDGRVIKKDVQDFIKNRKLRSPEEARHETNLISNTIPGDGTNIFVPAVAFGILNGTVSADNYNKKVKEIFKERAITVTQEELEHTVRELLNPYFNAGDPNSLNSGTVLELKDMSNNGIAILHNKVIVGWVNNPDVTFKNINLIKELLQAKTAEEVKALVKDMDYLSKGQKMFVDWRLREIEDMADPKKKKRDKSLVMELDRLNVAYNNEIAIKSMMDLNKGTGIKQLVKIVRKSSGNLASTPKKTSIKSEFPQIKTLFVKMPFTIEPVLTDPQTGVQFSRNPDATYYFNHDLNYTHGLQYIMVPGANSFPDQLNTMIPVPVFSANADKAIAKESTDIISRIVEKARELIVAGETSIFNHPDIAALRFELEHFFPIDFSNKLNENYIQITDTFIKFDFEKDGKKHHVHLYYYAKNSGDTLIYDTKEKKRPNEGYKDTTVYPFVSASGNPTLALTVLNSKNIKNEATEDRAKRNAKAFRRFLEDAFSNKRTHINLSSQADFKTKDFRGSGMSYIDYMIEHDQFLTDLTPLKDGKGRVMRDEYGNPLPNITGKYDNKKNSNFIIGVSPIVTGSNAELDQNIASKEVGLEPEAELKGSTILGIANKASKAMGEDIDAIIKELLTTQEYSLENVANPTKLFIAINRALPNGYIVSKSKTKLTLKKVDHVTDSGNGNPGPDTRFKRASKGEQVKIVINEENAKSWWKATFGGHVNLDMSVIGVINKGGQLAWGFFEDAMVSISQSAPEGTQFHEAYHVAHWLYLTDAEQKEILDEARKEFGNLTELHLEERLADELEKYILRSQLEEQEDTGTAISKFFKKIWNLVKQLFRTYTHNETKIEEVFRKIKSGKFNYAPDAQRLAAAKKIRRLKTIEGLSAPQEAEVISVLAYKLLTLPGSDVTVDVNPSENITKEQIRDSLINDIRLVDDEQAEHIAEITDDEIFDKLWNKTKLYIQRQFNVTLNDKDLIDSEIEVGRKWDDSIFSVSQKNNVNVLVKSLIMSTPSNDVGDFLGLRTYLDFNRVYPHLQRIMLGASSTEEMMLRLEIAGDFDNSLRLIADRLRVSPNLRSAWFSVFYKQSPKRLYILFGEDEIKVDRSNKNISHYIISNDWISKFETNLFAEAFTPVVVQQLNELRNDVYKAKMSNDISTAVNKAASAFKILGIDIDSNKIMQLLTLPHIQAKEGNNEVQLFNKYLAPVFNLVEREISSYNRDKENYSFSSTGNLNNLALLQSLISYDLMENSGLDVKGNIVFSVMNPNFLSQFMDVLKAVDVENLQQVDNIEAQMKLLEVLREYARDPINKHSNWLWSHGDNKGLLTLVDGEPNAERLTIAHLNLANIQEFSYELLDGLKDSISRDSSQYKNMPDKDWDLTQMLLYLNEAHGKGIKVPVVIQADSGNINTINSPRFKGVKDTGAVPEHSSVFQALRRIVLQDLEGAVAARNLMFNYNKGKLTVKKDLNKSILLRYYHYNEVDSNGVPILLDSNGLPTGNVFKSYQIDGTETLASNNGIPVYDKLGEAKSIEFEEELNKVVTDFIKREVKTNYKYLTPYINTLKLNKNFVKRYNNNFKQFAVEFLLNHFISNVEQQNFFSGRASQYKPDKEFNNRWVYDPNKRAKGVSSPGVGMSDVVKETFRVATLKDIVLGSEYVSDMAEAVASILKKENPKFKGVKFNVANFNKKTPSNELETEVLNVLGDYLETNTGDAQGYITLDRYEEIQRGLGRLSTEMRDAIRRARLGNSTLEDISKFLKPIKGFYYSRRFDRQLGMMVSSQIKYATVPLVPGLVHGNQLQELYTWAKDNSLDEIIFESAEKVGSRLPLDITDSNGSIVKSKLDKFTTTNSSFKDFYNKDWRLQVDSPDHFVDEVNKLGTQISKLIIANLNPKATYFYNGSNHSAKELIQDFMDTISDNIQKDADKLLERMGIDTTDGQYTISDLTKIQKVMKSELNRVNSPDNYLDAIELIEDAAGNTKFNVPLFMTAMAKKWESILTSMFTNNVVNQKHPGGSLVLMSSAFITKPTKIAVNEDTDVNNIMSDFHGVTGIDWIQEKRESGDFRLKPPTFNENGVEVAEILIPRWSKNLYRVNDEGISEPIPIDEIDSDILEQLWYRIPYEKKGSSVIARVVGFLPESAGNVIVTPHELITMSGEDHDFDKRYGMYHNTFVDNSGRLHRYRKYNTHSDEAFNQWLHSNIARQYKKEFYLNPTEAFNRASTQVKRFITVKRNRAALHESLFEESEIAIHTLIEDVSDRLNIPLEADLTLSNLTQIMANRLRVTNELLTAHNESKGDTFLEGAEWDEFLATQRVFLDTRRELYSLFNRINTLKRRFGEAWEFLSYSGKDIKDTQKRRQEVIDRYSSLKQDVVLSELRNQFNSLPLSDINPRESNENHIIDIMSSILKNPSHFKEMMQPSGFATAKSVIKEIEELIVTDNKEEMKFSSFGTQRFLRSRNVDGIALKGMSANAHAFLSIQQLAESELRSDLGVVFKYPLENAKELKLKYGDNNVAIHTKDNVAYVRHIRAGWNLDGSYTNTLNQLMTDATSEILSLTLDIVKEGMIPNVNTYTFNIFMNMLSVGVDIRTASLYINQPFIRQLSELYFENQSIISEEFGKEISKTKSYYYQQILDIRTRLGQVDVKGSELTTLFSKISNNALTKDEAKALLGLKEMDNKHGTTSNLVVEDGQIFSAEELKDMLRYSFENFELDVASTEVPRLKRALRFLTNQVYVAEKLLVYKEGGEAMHDASKALGQDRKQVGPLLSNVLEMHSAIYHSAHYDSPFMDYAPASDIGYLINTELEPFAEKVNIANNTIEEGLLAEGARLFTKLPDGTKVPLVVGVLPSHFRNSTHASKYKLLDIYKQYGHDLAFNTISPHFLNYDYNIRQFAYKVLRYLGKRFDAELYDKATSFAITSLMSRAPWLASTDRNRLFGVDKKAVAIDQDISIEEFEDLSVANKLLLVKEFRNDIDGTNHILNFLYPKLNDSEVKRVGYQEIEFLNSLSDTTLDNTNTDSFLELWNSSNEYERSLARDLVRYSFFTNGFSSKLNSFSKLIPIDIFTSQETGLVNHLEWVKNNSAQAIELEPDLLKRFIQSQHYNTNIVPRVELSNSYNRAIFQVSANRLIKVNKNRLPLRLVDKNFFTVSLYGTKEDMPIKIANHLYELVYEDENTKTFAPITKYGNAKITETSGERSVIKSNNVMFDLPTYARLIEQGTSLNSHGFPYVKHDSPIATLIMWEYATAQIGDTQDSTFLQKSFIPYAKKSFKEDSNKTEYNSEDLVLITAETTISDYKGSNAADTIINNIFDNDGKFKGTYKLIDKALSDDATVMLPSKIDSNNNAIPDVNPSFHVGLSKIQDALDRRVKAKELSTIISNGIVYYAKPNKLHTIDNHKCIS